MGLGAGLMYFYDPDRGQRRRSMVQDKVASMQHSMEESMQKGTRDLHNRTKGLSYEAKGMMSGASEGSDKDVWSPGVRTLAYLGGGGLLLSGLVRGGFMGTLRMLIGGGVLARAMTNKPIKDVVGVSMSEAGTTPGAIDVQKGINVNAPVEDVFKLWHDYESWPKFMSFVREIRWIGDRRTHWVARGPGGITVEWQARETHVEPNRVISWESEPGSLVKNSGTARFVSNPDGTTRVDLRLSYTPPAGVLGNALASLIGVNPEQAMDENLMRFKSLIEHGQTTKEGQKVTREQVGV
jgi:uncharacterized membrane protein